MTARVLVVGDPLWEDPATIHTVCQKAYLTLRPDAGQVLWSTLNQDGPEVVAETWWTSHGMLTEPTHKFGNRYVTLSNILRDVVPDLVLIFGDSNLCQTAAARCTEYGIRFVHIP